MKRGWAILRFLAIACLSIWDSTAKTVPKSRDLQGKTAIILTDTKLDDKAAVGLIMRKRNALDQQKFQYDKLIIIITGVEDRGKCGKAMEDFMERAGYFSSPSQRLRLHWFKTRQNIMGIEAPHERWYEDLSGMEMESATGKSLAKVVGDDEVDVFQIAPLADTDAWEFMDALPKIRVWHLFAGYNSRQGKPSDHMTPDQAVALAQRQNQFQRDLQPNLSKKHREGRVIFTLSKMTYIGGKGSSAPLNWALKYLPQKDVMQAMRDPFWTLNIIIANKYADHSAQITKVTVPESIDSDGHEQFMSHVVNARSKETPLRHEIQTMLENACAKPQYKTEEPRSHMRCEILLSEFKGQPSATVEFGDAYHIASLFTYFEGKESVKLTPAEPDVKQNNPKMPGFILSGGDGTHGWLLTGCKLEDAKRLIEKVLTDENESGMTSGSKEYYETK